jgi:hypothetical protein
VSNFDTVFGNLPLTEQAPYSLDADSADPGLFELNVEKILDEEMTKGSYAQSLVTPRR